MAISNWQLAALVPYDNSVSGLTATNVQAAIDEITSASGSPAWLIVGSEPRGIGDKYGPELDGGNNYVLYKTQSTTNIVTKRTGDTYFGALEINDAVTQYFGGSPPYFRTYIQYLTSDRPDTAPYAAGLAVSVIDEDPSGVTTYGLFQMVATPTDYSGTISDPVYGSFSVINNASLTATMTTAKAGVFSVSTLGQITTGVGVSVEFSPIDQTPDIGSINNATGILLDVLCCATTDASDLIPNEAYGIRINQVSGNGSEAGATAYGIYIADSAIIADSGTDPSTNRHVAFYNADATSVVWSESKIVSSIGFDLNATGSATVINIGMRTDTSNLFLVAGGLDIITIDVNGLLYLGLTTGPDTDFEQQFPTQNFTSFTELKEDPLSASTISATSMNVLTLNNATSLNYSTYNFGVLGVANVTSTNNQDTTDSPRYFGGGYFAYLNMLNDGAIINGVTAVMAEVSNRGVIPTGSCVYAVATTTEDGADEGVNRLIKGVHVNVETNLSSQSGTESNAHQSDGFYVEKSHARLSTTTNKARGLVVAGSSVTATGGTTAEAIGILIESSSVTATGGTTNTTYAIKVEDDSENYFEGLSTFKNGVKVKDTGAGSTTLSHYQEVAESNLGTLTWTAGTAPSGSISKLYRATRIGNRVDLWCRIEASTPGVTVTQVSFPLPSDTGINTPVAFTGMGNSEFNVSGSGAITVGGTLPAAGPCNAYLGKDGGGVWTVYITGPSSSADTAFCHISYFV